MKRYLKISVCCLTLSLFLLSSCHKEGCPGKITDNNQQIELIQDC